MNWYRLSRIPNKLTIGCLSTSNFFLHPVCFSKQWPWTTGNPATNRGQTKWPLRPQTSLQSILGVAGGEGFVRHLFIYVSRPWIWLDMSAEIFILMESHTMHIYTHFDFLDLRPLLLYLTPQICERWTETHEWTTASCVEPHCLFQVDIAKSGSFTCVYKRDIQYIGDKNHKVCLFWGFVIFRCLWQLYHKQVFGFKYRTCTNMSVHPSIHPEAEIWKTFFFPFPDEINLLGQHWASFVERGSWVWVVTSKLRWAS